MIKSLLCFFSFFIPLLAQSLENKWIDLEQLSQPFVLETKQMEIPGYPDAFNPSIIRWKGSLLLSFRFIPDPKSTFVSYIGLVKLDESFNPIEQPQIMEIRSPISIVPSRIDDGRLIQVKDSLYFVYSDNEEAIISRKGFRVYVTQLIEHDHQFSITPPECLNSFEGQSDLLREKNWVPFDYNQRLFLSYSLSPHIVFRPLLDRSGRCETYSKCFNTLQWKWGEPRGGTSALKIESGEYLSFFHSSILMATAHSEGEEVFHYFMGAYTYAPTPPFQLVKMSNEPIVGKNFYQGKKYKPYWKPIACVFPVGFVMDSHHIWLTYGRQDRECWVVKMDKEGLLNSLQECK